MAATGILTNTVYYMILVMFCLYGIHRYRIVRLYRQHRNAVPEFSKRFPVLPRVTVQLPVYNEKYVVKRLIDSVCAMDYPRDRLEIQVLDDSTDETTAIISERISHYHRQGYDIKLLHRFDRQGFKAGALRDALELAKGEFIAIFDADFIPPPRFLLDSVHHFTDPKVGMVQQRWDHMNRDHSWLTQIQSIFLDGHFVLEQAARHRSGCYFNFNGTAGVWRRKAIVTSGGWTCDTLTEDLDLSYRAQLNGWRFVYLLDRTAAGEVPVDMNAFKTQQHRWAKGSIQTAKKILPAVWRSRLPLRLKLEATVHLTSNALHLFIVLLSLLFLPVMMTRVNWHWRASLPVDAVLLLLGTFSILRYYYHSQRQIGAGVWRSLAGLPGLLCLGAGVSLNNTRAVLEAVLGRASGFVRTPKYGVTGSAGLRQDGDYRKKPGGMAYFEIVMAVYLGLAVGHAALQGYWLLLPFPLMFMVGFWVVGLGSFWHGRRGSVARMSEEGFRV